MFRNLSRYLVLKLEGNPAGIENFFFTKNNKKSNFGGRFPPEFYFFGLNIEGWIILKDQLY